MTWLTWRQHRTQAAVLAATLVLIAVGVTLLLVLGAADLTAIGRCASGAASCGTNYYGQYTSTYPWGYVVEAAVALPALVGILCGAPLVPHEVEHGTHLLVWSQGVTRQRWFLGRVGMVAVGVLLAGAVLAAAAQGWFFVQRSAGDPIEQTLWAGFEIGPPVVIAYMLFALALGVAAGALVRRTGPAMLLTLVGYIAVRVTILLTARTRYLAPVTMKIQVAGEVSSGGAVPGIPHDAWRVSAGPTMNAAGGVVQMPPGDCAWVGPPPGPYGCPQAPALFQWQAYQPVSRFWLFQGIEAAIFVVLALALLALAHRLILRLR